MKIPNISDENFKLKIIGKSGVFKTRHKHAVEYLQTTLPIHKLKLIEPVRRKFKKGELDFELMLQRDLDDKRVKDEIIPYLKRDNKLSFFPPILVVILEVYDKPLENNKAKTCADIKEYYPEMITTTDSSDTSEYQVRSFGDLFSIHIFQDDNRLQRWCTELRVGHKATLLAIDGQHRLVALQAVSGLLEEDEASEYNPNPAEFQEDFHDLEVPVTFIFIPDSHENGSADKLTAIFRQIFVDVNKNARTVTSMRNVLLEEHDVRAIFTRLTCSFLREKAQEGNTDYISIDEVEWDKDSREFQITSPIAITNLIFMKEILDVWIIEDETGSSLKSFLRLDRYKTKLKETEYPYNDLGVYNYSYTQKETLKTIFKENYQEGFANLFSSIPFAMERSALVRKLKNNLDRCTDDVNDPDHQMARIIRKFLFEGNEHKNKSKMRGFRPSIKQQLSDLTKFDNGHFLSFVRTAMFQVAYLKLVKILYDLAEEDDFKKFSLNFRKIIKTKKFLKLWEDVIIKNKKELEHALKGRYSYSKGKSELVCKFLKIIFKENKAIFKPLKVNWKRLDTDAEGVRKKFLETYSTSIEDNNDEVKSKKLKYFEDFLSRVYLPKPKIKIS